MKGQLIPNLLVEDIFQIPLADLKERGIHALFFDLDNTLVEWNALTVTDDIVAWFAALPDAGFEAMILSNNSAARIAPVAERLAIPYWPRAGKPGAAGARAAAVQLGAAARQCALVGDQIMTDIRAGNRAGFYTILVPPISRREFIGTKLNRQIEKLIYRHYLRQRHRYRR